MKRIIFLLIISLLTGHCLSAQNTDDVKALYFSAVDDYTTNDCQSALKKIDQIEKKLGGTNARLSYLKAKAQYKLANPAEAQKACENYFASAPKKDPGYDEMLRLSEQVNNQLQMEQKRRTDEANAQRSAIEEKMQKEQDAAKAAEEQMKVAAEQRAQDAETQKIKNAAEADAFQKVQKTNTKEAYQNFIYAYPSGKYAAQAQNEMQKKWPSPTRVLKNSKYGYVDATGKMVIKAVYDQALEFNEGFARVGKNNKYGFINEKGKVVIPIEYVSASNFNYGEAAVKPSLNEAYFIDKTGKAINSDVYRDAKSFSEGLAAVQDNYYRYGFINSSGELVIPFEYNIVSWFKEGIASVGKSEGGKTLYGYIDKDGNKLTVFEYEEAKDFQNGVARVKKDGKYGLIDKFGSPITYCRFDYISDFNGDGLALAKKDGYDIMLDMNGQPWIKVNNKLVKITLQ